MSRYLLIQALVLSANLCSYAQEHKTNQSEQRESITTTDTVKTKKGEILAEVMITASARKVPVNVGKSNIKPLDLPQSVAVINQSTLQNQQIANMTDILKNTNGVYIMGNTGGFQEEIASRGYAMGSSNTFKNGVRYFNGMPTETSGIEKVEFLKGSAAILFGNVTAGGVLNIITKKPRFEFGADAGITAGSFDTYKTTFDVYGGIGKGKTMAFRMNGSNTQANSFRIGVSSESKYVNPSFLINFNDRTSLLIEADYQKDFRTADFGAGIINYELVDLPRSRFVGVSWAYNKAEQASLTTTLKHDFNENWNINFINSFRYYKTDLFANTRPNAVLSSPANAAPILSVDANGNWKRGLQRSEAKDNYWLQEVNVKGNFKTWNVSHQLLVGIDTDTYKTTTLASVYKNPLPLKNYANEYDTINIFTTDLSTARNDVPNMDKNTLTTAPIKRVGAYIQDLIHFNQHFKALLGVRYSYQDTENEVYTFAATNPTPRAEKTVVTNQYDDAFSPRIGLIFQPNAKQSVFASYSNSFVPNTGLDYETKAALKPSTIHQYEIGSKNELFHDRLYANLTLYQIENNNLAQNSLIDANFRELAGGTKSKGVEIDIVAYPVKGLSVMAGYSFTEIKYTASNIFIVGSSILYMPKNTANLNFNYNFDKGKLKGLNLGLINSYIGARYAGRSTNLITSNDPRKPVALPDYFQNDFTLGYKINQITLRGKMSNIFNVLSYNVHDDNSVNPIAPTNYSVSLNYTF
ncbi:TonB-dependent receptor [Flavobacterium sp.]|uniref:TonB-dependent siderophore receptor n=1 Tax=Flavobacterium sp. TaxID=239 RepID=UPI0026206A68|nr:TonB-dependent receptor [Flavobacterium sp.]